MIVVKYKMIFRCSVQIPTHPHTTLVLMLLLQHISQAKVQTEGGLVQGIGMALSEGVTYTDKGKIIENSFMQYKVPARVDISRIKVFFESSWEPTGPFGAKSIGEIVINTPSPAIAHAVFKATGTWQRELPITPEKVWRGTKK